MHLIQESDIAVDDMDLGGRRTHKPHEWPVSKSLETGEMAERCSRTDCPNDVVWNPVFMVSPDDRPSGSQGHGRLFLYNSRELSGIFVSLTLSAVSICDLRRDEDVGYFHQRAYPLLSLLKLSSTRGSNCLEADEATDLSVTAINPLRLLLGSFLRLEATSQSAYRLAQVHWPIIKMVTVESVR